MLGARLAGEPRLEMDVEIEELTIMFHSIVLAYDGSPDGREALKQGVDLAAVFSAEVYLVAVIDLFSSGMAAMEGPVFFSEQQQNDAEETLIVECNLEQIDVVRTHWPFLRDRRIDAYGEITKRFVD